MPVEKRGRIPAKVIVLATVVVTESFNMRRKIIIIQVFMTSGDSGGPLMKTIFDNSTSELRTFQLGIVSVGAQRCGSAIPAIYTKVSYFIHWILDHMGP